MLCITVLLPELLAPANIVSGANSKVILLEIDLKFLIVQFIIMLCLFVRYHQKGLFVWHLPHNSFVDKFRIDPPYIIHTFVLFTQNRLNLMGCTWFPLDSWECMESIALVLNVISRIFYMAKMGLRYLFPITIIMHWTAEFMRKPASPAKRRIEQNYWNVLLFEFNLL